MNLNDTLQRILTGPTPADLWQLQGDLLVMGTEPALKARQVAGDFYLYLSDLESKVTSRRHSRWAAAFATASVTTVSLHELLDEPVNVCKQLLFSGAPALLEICSAAQGVKAWEVEADLVHHDAAWRLYGELWNISTAMLPNLPPAERRARLDGLLGPVVAAETPAHVKAALLIRLYQVVLVARLAPMLAQPA